jgi:ElaB/YqjD/DUF883 family membrane-anchored ribosome-binding protein
MLLVWVYYAAQIVLFGAELTTTTRLTAARGARKPRMPPLPTRPTSEQSELLGVVPVRVQLRRQKMTQASRPRHSDDLIDKGAEQVRKVADRVEGLASGAAGQMREASDRTGEVADNFKGALDKSVRDQPMATLALAAAVGFVLGALWKS